MKQYLLSFLILLFSFGLFAQPGQKAISHQLTANSQQGKGYKTEWTSAPFDYQVFIENKGQYDGKIPKGTNGIDADEKILFAARNGQSMAYFTGKGVIYRYDEFVDKDGRPITSAKKKVEKGKEDDDEEAKDIPYFLSTNWKGCNQAASITTSEKINSFYSFKSSYTSPSGEQKGYPIKASAYRLITYHDIYPGIDAVYSFVKGKEGFKYSLVVHPGADLSQVKLAYNGAKELKIDANGNFNADCKWGGLKDQNPVGYYEESNNKVNVSFKINNNEETFIADNLSAGNTLVIDPNVIVWTTTNPIVATNLGAYDIDYDYNGNVYVYGGSYPYELVKLNSAGTVLWTYTTSNFPYTYYGDFCVDKVGGSVYACEGFGSTVGALTDKINNAGVFVSSYQDNSGEDEEWRIEFDLCNHQIVIAGGGTYDLNQAATLDTNMTTFTYVDVLNFPNNAYQYDYHDMVGIAMDPFGSACYMATAWTYANSSLDNNVIVKLPLPSLGPTTYNVPDGFDFQECMSPSYTGTGVGNTNGMNCMAASPNWLYMYDGLTLKQFNVGTGAQNASAVVGGSSFGWGGIDVDLCDDIYLGNSSNILIYNSALANTGTIAMPGTVYDVALGNGVLNYGATTLYACGNGFVSRVTISPPNPPTITKVVTAGGCSLCTGTATATLNLCGSPYTTNLSYLWSNGQTTSTATNLCQGIDSVKITLGCGTVFSDTVNIPPGSGSLALTTTQLNANCATLGSATVSASGGASPYTYSWSPSGGSNSTATGLTAGTYTITVKDANGCTSSSVVTILSTSSLNVTISNTNENCAGGNNATATATASNGTSPYTYSWAPSGGSNATATGLIAGTYTVYITDANGCSTTDTITITQPTPITATTSTTQSICGNNNGSATVVASGGTSPYIYSWSPSGGSNALATGLGAGTYTCTITDANGCTFTITAIVGLTSTLSASITSSTNVLCFGGNTGSATVSATGGFTPYTYQWLPSGGSNSTATGLTAGTYTVSVTDSADCSIVVTITITQPPLLTSTMGSPTNVSCFGGNNGTATVSVSGGTSPYIYSWAPNGGTNAAGTGFTAGTYTVYITDANGCTASASVVITQPPSFTATTTSINVSCAGNNGSVAVVVSGGNSPYIYSWSPVSSSNAIITALSAGTYTIVVTDANGCTVSATATITQPPALTVTTSNTNINCFGDINGSASATAAGGNSPYTYSWSPGGGTTSSISNLSAGTYTITVFDADNCTATASVTIIQPSSPLSVTISGPTSVCFGAPAKLTSSVSGGTGPYIYSWAPSGASTDTTTVYPVSITTYTIFVTDANGCTESATITVIVDAPLGLTVTGDTTVCSGGTIYLNAQGSGGDGTYFYKWLPSGITNQWVSFILTKDTIITVEVTDACGSAMVSKTINVLLAPTPDVSFNSNPNIGCYPLCIQFRDFSTITSGNIIAWDWNFGNGDSSLQKNPIYCYNDTGTFTVTLTATSSNGCSSTLRILNMIKVYPHPVANFIYTPDPVNIMNPLVQFTDESTGTYSINQWYWKFGDGSNVNSDQNPSHLYSDTGTYCVHLMIIDIHGCIDSTTKCLDVEPLYTFYIPDAFTPNGDGINDVFQPKGTYIRSYEMYIFDRWGMKLYHTTDFYTGWNGEVNNVGVPCQEDTYVYVIYVFDTEGNKHTYTGRVNLIR